MNTKEHVLVTGASSGIGLELAREFAKHGHAVTLVARVQSELEQIAQEFRTAYQVPVSFIAKDLSQPNAAQEIFNEVLRGGQPVGILVNNAGLGQRGRFWEIPLEKYEEMVGVNIMALLRLTHLFLPAMVAQGRGKILNTASVAGFEPGPLLAAYHASKAFVLSLSEALAVELEDTGVTLTALCPGPTDTDFFPKADMVETKAFQKAHVMSPQEVAAAGYEALMRGDPLYVAGGANKAMVFKRRFMSLKGQAKANQKLYETAKPQDRKRRSGDIEREAEEKRVVEGEHIVHRE